METDDEFFARDPESPHQDVVPTTAQSRADGDAYRERQERYEQERAEAGFYPTGDGNGAMSMREFVCSNLAGGFKPDRIRKVLKDPLTGRPFTKERFEEAFKDEIENGGDLAYMRSIHTVYTLGTRDTFSKTANIKLKAATTFLERRWGEAWAPANQKLSVDVTTKIEQENAAKQGVDLMKEMLRQMADSKRSMPMPVDVKK